MNSLSFADSHIKFIIHQFWAFFRTDAAGDTFIHVNITGLFPYGHGKIALLTCNIFNLRQCQYFYVQVPTALNQSWGYDSHGTVIGWKGFIQPGHSHAYSGFLFN